MRILGVKVYGGTKTALLEEIVSSDSFIEIHPTNAEVLIQARNDAKLFEILKDNEHNPLDGHWPARFVSWKYGTKAEKISGSDLIYGICEKAESARLRVFLLGASEEVSKTATDKLKLAYPGLSVARYSPPVYASKIFPEAENQTILSAIADFKPHIVVVCFGAPKQECWIEANRESLKSIGVRVALSAGGTLDFVAGKVSRCPVWIQKAGFEWLYRLFKEPKTRFRRQMTRLPIFLVLSVMDILKYWMTGKE